MFGFMNYVLQFLYLSSRPLIKGLLRRFTRLCELQRICYGLQSGAPRTMAVEKSLSLSRCSAMRDILVPDKRLTFREALEHSVKAVLKVKKIKPNVHPEFPKILGKCFEQIWGYIGLCDIIEELRKTSYDSDNTEHEDKLLCLWSILVSNQKLNGRVTKQWQDIGFQGDDPKTDFRGMGMLGLENLIYFAKEHTSIAQRILMRSLHPQHGYAFAIVGINLTHLTYQLVRDGSAKTHVYNSTRSPPTIRSFHQLYCFLFVEFDKFWLSSKPNNIMDFSSVRNRFECNIRERLKDNKAYLKIVVAVDNV